MTTVLDYVIRRACESYSHNGTEFTTANFQTAFAKIVAATPAVTPQAAEVILLSMPRVSRVGLCQWRFNLFEATKGAER